MLVSHRRDQFIEFIKGLLQPSFVLDALAESAANSWAHIEELIEEHRASEGKESRLRTAVPTLGVFHTPLPLEAAWRSFDGRFKVSARRFVAPSFNEIREILNLAQVMAFEATPLKFVSFDGDCTLYSDGKNFNDAALAAQIERLLRVGVTVALVTAAGYGYESERYERRLEGLLRVFDESRLPGEALRRFFVCGGECNYLLQLDRDDGDGGDGDGGAGAELRSREATWDVSFDDGAAAALLDCAEASLRASVDDMRLAGARVIRKNRAVGLVPRVSRREQLDEAVLRVQEALRNHATSPPVPFCAFNGGSDVWVDVGTKREGVQGFQRLLGIKPESCLHIGDQFLITGNDYASRSTCPTLWIANPSETKRVLADILAVVDPNEENTLHRPPSPRPPPSEAATAPPTPPPRARAATACPPAGP